MENKAEKGEIVVKKWDFGGKRWVIGVEKYELRDQNRKAKWC